MNKFVSLSFAVTASTLTIGTAPAYATNCNLDFSQMFVFGDSLSDPGNTNGTRNGRRYFERRASNGNVFADILAESCLDLDPVTYYRPRRGGVSSDGANFARGGNDSGEKFGEQIDDFINDFLDEGQSANSNALYTVWIGANDYIKETLLGSDAESDGNPDIVVENIADAIRNLHGEGAEDFLIPNLPLFGFSPLATSRSESASERLNQLTDDHNQKLELKIAELEEELSEVTITLLDVDSIFNEILDNPSQLGFTNVTDNWLETVLDPSACNNAFDCDVDLADPDRYLFWDYLHPTKAFHKLVANEAISALNSEYNQAVPEYNQAVPEASSTLSLLGLGLSFLGMSAFKQKDIQKQKQKV
ncbi:SGNH/GDSL hydrolase family protein [Okeania sp. KiyG1]|uniref:SGNH/GDSL hydrolase family protein n=1 Tax=Okeania sp. KiyG1 TaxID=2720165 RepID=UPI0019230CF1|nr:SGNH/GDSL hydrolase family protein [Okeania sp. KiyG1]GGA13244.1 lysophospholipase [Okeania sp. KiyG1]